MTNVFSMTKELYLILLEYLSEPLLCNLRVLCKKFSTRLEVRDQWLC